MGSVKPPQITSETKICLITHVDADGIGAGLIVREAMRIMGQNDKLPFIAPSFLGYANGIGQRLKEAVEAREYDIVFITDICIRNNKDGDQDMSLFVQLVKDHPQTVFVWCDHHPTDVDVELYTLSNIYFKIITDKSACGADLIYEMLEEMYSQENLPDFKGWQDIKQARILAHDYDLWHKKIPESQDLNDVIATMGPRKAFDALKEDTSILFDFTRDRTLWSNIKRARADREGNIKRAQDMKTELVIDGQKYIFSVCVSYPSEVAHAILGEDKEAVAIVLCIGSHESPGAQFKPAISVRRIDGSKVDLKPIGEKLGGGGHSYASGGRIPTEYLLRAMLDQTIEYCSDRLV